VNLLPCPFCGGEAKIVQNTDYIVFIGCESPECLGCFAIPVPGCDMRHLIAERWNRRVASPPITVGVLTEEQKQVARSMGAYVP
jgi:Restriction alleviation protein Lar